MIDIKQDYFKLFALPQSFEVDLNALSERYLILQKALHPDRHTQLSESEQRVAEQYTAYLNEAQRTLKSPLLRAQYLLQLVGIDASGEYTAGKDTAFLMQQLELREQLEQVPSEEDPFAVLSELSDLADDMLKVSRNNFEQSYQNQNLSEAAATVEKMQFLEKLIFEIDLLEDRLED